MELRPVLEHLEGSPEADLTVQLAYLAGGRVELDEEELHGALRRSLLLLATGGDPRRDLDPDGRAVTALGDDLASPARRAQLETALAELASAAAALPRVAAAAAALRADPDFAWRRFSASLVADALATPSTE